MHTEGHQNLWSFSDIDSDSDFEVVFENQKNARHPQRLAVPHSPSKKDPKKGMREEAPADKHEIEKLDSDDKHAQDNVGRPNDTNVDSDEDQCDEDDDLKGEEADDEQSRPVSRLQQSRDSPVPGPVANGLSHLDRDTDVEATGSYRLKPLRVDIKVITLLRIYLLKVCPTNTKH